MISFDNRREITERVMKSVKEVSEKGQKEYAHDTDNALANFERLAKELNLTREKVLWVYFKKHLDGILAHINGHTSQHEPVDGRIMDAITYLILLQCMIDDTKENDKMLARMSSGIGGMDQRQQSGLQNINPQGYGLER